jgi:hypothetical protein
MRGITGRTLTVALFVTETICRRQGGQVDEEARHSLADAWLRR